MHLIRRLPESLERPTAVAIGNFDGVHRGHQAVIAAMKRAADAYELMPTVLTFEPHPRRFFTPDVPDFRLERVRAKFARLAQEGVECTVVPRFDAAFASIPADVFMEDVLAHRLNAKAVVVGENFVFGHKRAGDIDLLTRWGTYNDIEIIAVPPVMVGAQVCSSSAVRTSIAMGDMPQAARLLGRAYMLSGRVVHGQARGRKIGFPTANLALPPGLLMPAYGVYAVYVGVGSNHYSGVANFGVRPTLYADGRPVCEVHLFDMQGDLYGQPMRVFMVKRLRDEMKFDEVDALAAQIATDCLQARVALGGLE